MRYCAQCGCVIPWWKRALGFLWGTPTRVNGVELGGRAFCSDHCRSRFSELARAENARQIELSQAELSRAEDARKDEVNRKRRERAADLKRARAEEADRLRADRLRDEQTKQQRSEQAKISRQKRKERKERAIAVTDNPLDPSGYVRLADSLVDGAGVLEHLRTIQEMDPESLWGGFWLTVEESGTLARKLKRGTHLLVEAKEAYLKAIVLNTDVDSYASACHKLNYAFISCLSLADPDDQQFTVEASHYAREAEKDLRQHLRKNPDDTAALKKLAQAIAIYQSNAKTRSQRLASVNARIKEANTRLALGTGPPSGLGAPGAPESPYPDNWDEVRKIVKDRDDHCCTQCNAVDVEFHVHHIVPLSKGGGNELDNLVTLCDICHREEHSG